MPEPLVFYDEVAPVSAEVYERLLNPRSYPYGEVLLTLRELVAVKRSLWGAAWSEALAMTQDLDLHERL